jgi:acyl-CoA dehydrogenase
MDVDALLAELRSYVRSDLIPSEERLERDGRVPDEITERFRGMGLFGITIPEAYGGSGLGLVDQVRVVLELTYASVVYRSRLSTTVGLAAQAVLREGTEEQRRWVLPRFATGEWTGAFALTEEHAGSDAAGVRTTARRDGDAYVLDGRKRYITNAPDADLFVVVARTGDERRTGLSAFLVEAGTPGFEPGPPVPMMGQAGSRVAEIDIRSARVPAENLIGGVEGRGLETALAGINAARLHIGATCAGQCRRLTDEALAHARDREQFGRPLVQIDAVGALLADCEVDTLAATETTLGVARRSDRDGSVPHEEIAAVKLFTTEALGRVADRAVQVLGGLGYVKGHAVERLYRDARLFRIFEGTSQIQQRAIARSLAKRNG